MKHRRDNQDKPCNCPKRAYYNREEAEESAAYQMEQGSQELAVYRCPENQYVWHLSRLIGDDRDREDDVGGQPFDRTLRQLFGRRRW